ncbi:MAG: hypothetical protein JST12_14890 [Armatimonadetes bacterium]|nr:hypothetical protein [Armatimonadota bacterium]
MNEEPAGGALPARSEDESPNPAPESEITEEPIEPVEAKTDPNTEEEPANESEPHQPDANDDDPQPSPSDSGKPPPSVKQATGQFNEFLQDKNRQASAQSFDEYKLSGDELNDVWDTFIRPEDPIDADNLVDNLVHELSNANWFLLDGPKGSGRKWAAIYAATEFLGRDNANIYFIEKQRLGDTFTKIISSREGLLKGGRAVIIIRAEEVTELSSQLQARLKEALEGKAGSGDPANSGTEIHLKLILITSKAVKKAIQWRPKWNAAKLMLLAAEQYGVSTNVLELETELKEFLHRHSVFVTDKSATELTSIGREWAMNDCSFEWLETRFKAGHRTRALALLNEVRTEPYKLAYVVCSCILNEVEVGFVQHQAYVLASMLDPKFKHGDIPFGFGDQWGRQEKTEQREHGYLRVQYSNDRPLCDEVANLFRSREPIKYADFLTQIGLKTNEDRAPLAARLAVEACIENSSIILPLIRENWFNDHVLLDLDMFNLSTGFLVDAYHHPGLRSTCWDIWMRLLTSDSLFSQFCAANAVLGEIGIESGDSNRFYDSIVDQVVDEDEVLLWASKTITNYMSPQTASAFALRLLTGVKKGVKEKNASSAGSSKNDHWSPFFKIVSFLCDSMLEADEKPHDSIGTILDFPCKKAIATKVVQFFVNLLDETLGAKGTNSDEARAFWFSLYADWIRRGRIDANFRGWTQLFVGALSKIVRHSNWISPPALPGGNTTVGTYSYWDEFKAQRYAYGLETRDNGYIDFLDQNLAVYQENLSQFMAVKE